MSPETHEIDQAKLQALRNEALTGNGTAPEPQPSPTEGGIGNVRTTITAAELEGCKTREDIMDVIWKKNGLNRAQRRAAAARVRKPQKKARR